jgi:hypothetical protein
MDSSNSTSPLTGTRGWVPQSHDRGTLDIIISCGLTIFLCIWTSVCPNVAAPEHGKQALLRNRFYMFLLGIIGPEFLLLGCVGQYSGARRNFNKFKASGYESWTMKHAFLADMGGIQVQVEGVKSFPVTGRGLHFLVTQGYIPYPSLLTSEALADKNKSDGLSR